MSDVHRYIFRVKCLTVVRGILLKYIIFNTSQVWQEKDVKCMEKLHKYL